MSTVYVVMGNDFPDAAFSTESAAAAYCKRKRADDKKLIEQGVKYEGWPGIHWRTYVFDLDAEVESA